MFVSHGFENVGSWAAQIPEKKDYAIDTSTSSHMIRMSSIKMLFLRTLGKRLALDIIYQIDMVALSPNPDA